MQHGRPIVSRAVTIALSGAMAWLACSAGRASAQSKTRPPIAAPSSAAAAAAARAALPPNIVLLVVRSMGWQDLSVPLYRDTTDANRRYLTPAIAALAKSGVTFTDAYADAPVSTPTRVALLTGLAPGVSRVTSLAITRNTDSSVTPRTLGAPGWNVNGLSATAAPLAVSAPTLPKLLRTAGYRTLQVGTTGWSARDVPGSDPRSIGFDETYPGERRADSLTADALKAIDAARLARKPFFLWLGYDAVREDGVPDDRFVDDAVARGLDSADAAFASRIAGVDRSVADLLAYLDANALSDRTIVVLLSDNGGPAIRDRPGSRHYQNAPLRGGLGSAYEGGARIPLFVRWPGVARAGFRSATPVSTADLFPTLLRAAKVPTLAAATRGVAGRDLASTLNNTAPVPFDRALWWHAPSVARANGPGVEPFTAVRVGQWKLIYFFADSRYELFDLSNDIGESKEQSLRRPEVAARLSDVLRQLLTDSNALLPIDAAYHRPVPLPGRLLVPTPP